MRLYQLFEDQYTGVDLWKAAESFIVWKRNAIRALRKHIADRGTALSFDKQSDQWAAEYFIIPVADGPSIGIMNHVKRQKVPLPDDEIERDENGKVIGKTWEWDRDKAPTGWGGANEIVINANNIPDLIYMIKNNAWIVIHEYTHAAQGEQNTGGNYNRGLKHYERFQEKEAVTFEIAMVPFIQFIEQNIEFGSWKAKLFWFKRGLIVPSYWYFSSVFFTVFINRIASLHNVTSLPWTRGTRYSGNLLRWIWADIYRSMTGKNYKFSKKDELAPDYYDEEEDNWQEDQNVGQWPSKK